MICVFIKGNQQNEKLQQLQNLASWAIHGGTEKVYLLSPIMLRDIRLYLLPVLKSCHNSQPFSLPSEPSVSSCVKLCQTMTSKVVSG